jgi:hypothetical protein
MTLGGWRHLSVTWDGPEDQNAALPDSQGRSEAAISRTDVSGNGRSSKRSLQLSPWKAGFFHFNILDRPITFGGAWS